MNSNGMDRSPKAMAQAKADHQSELINMHVWQTCLNCINWNGDIATANGPAGCGKFKAMPPPKIIVTGCRDYENDIPF